MQIRGFTPRLPFSGDREFMNSDLFEGSTLVPINNGNLK